MYWIKNLPTFIIKPDAETGQKTPGFRKKQSGFQTLRVEMGKNHHEKKN